MTTTNSTRKRNPHFAFLPGFMEMLQEKYDCTFIGVSRDADEGVMFWTFATNDGRTFGIEHATASWTTDLDYYYYVGGEMVGDVVRVSLHTHPLERVAEMEAALLDRDIFEAVS